ncbi:MAG: hypothetical protein ACRDQ4_18845 [Pseudonocardiaceae bacterium]
MKVGWGSHTLYLASVQNYLNHVRPFLLDHSARYGHLQEVTRQDGPAFRAVLTDGDIQHRCTPDRGRLPPAVAHPRSPAAEPTLGAPSTYPTSWPPWPPALITPK